MRESQLYRNLSMTPRSFLFITLFDPRDSYEKNSYKKTQCMFPDITEAPLKLTYTSF